ncbi:MAG TPA: leucyl/phenylalanyl-tRNA--protein transferase [Spirochaetota bacterium]|nr:leucyl/phenylalanyl-tRNA--protein transferase [Spirochaetota bacterium]HOM38753.1 leucyl/phenylalanyl-tRNA--protein transferase [Spirochaetota bacterium]HPQ49551.1 leucyl/phenylalanyl-tRNA--protein transferase [Spirochaetota bacterium]
MIYTKDDIAFIGPLITPSNVIKYYRMGAFPWQSDPFPIWWSPRERFVLKPDNIYINRTLRKFLKKSDCFKIKYDTAFSSVINMCKNTRDDTWITEEFITTYTKLNKMGYAHSVEVYYNNKLVGGLYGISLGKIFFGESMFHTMENTSKLAFVNLALNLKRLGFILIDCQVYTDTFKSFGAFFISRSEFEKIILINNEFETIKGRWAPPLFQDSICLL